MDATESIYGFTVEEAVVGVCIYEAAMTAGGLLGGKWRDAVVEATEALTAADFREPRPRELFRVVSDLRTAGRPVDPVTVMDALRETKREEAAGGFVYAAALFDAIHTVGHFPGHVRILVERQAVRDVGEVAGDVAKEAAEGPDDPAEFVHGAAARVARAAGAARLDAGDREPWAKSVHATAERLMGTGTADAGAVRTWLAPFDREVGGLDRSRLSLIAGRPGHGKSSFLATVANFVTAAGQRVVWFALEEDRETVQRRLLAQMARVDGNALKRRLPLGQEEARRFAAAVDKLAERHLRVRTKCPASARWIADETARIREAEGPVDLVLVDHVARMREPGRWDGNRHAELTVSIEGLCALAKEEGCALLAAHQLNRKVEDRADKRPVLSDLRDSGSLEESARLVLLLYRPWCHDRTKKPAVVELNVAKNSDGPTGTIDGLRFVPEFCAFEDETEDPT